MAKEEEEIIINIDVETKDATSGIKKIKKETKDLEDDTVEVKVEADTDDAEKSIGDVTKATDGLGSSIGMLGVSWSDVKLGFGKFRELVLTGLTRILSLARLTAISFAQMFTGQVVVGAQNLFKVVKAGIAATGIGLLVLAVVSLSTWLTKTKTGAEFLERAFSLFGATVSVLVDRLSMFGKAIGLLFDGEFAAAASVAANAVSGVTKEIIEEVQATNTLVKAQQKLADERRALNVETAKGIADVEKLKLIAEDVTKTYAEREAAAVKAFAKEKSLEDRRIKLAEEAFRLKKIEVDMSESLEEDLDALAEKEIELANIRQESAGRQISLQNFLNGLRVAEKAEKDADIAEAKAEKDLDDKKKSDREKASADRLRTLRNENIIAAIEDEKEKALKILEIQKTKELEEIKNMENHEALKLEVLKKYDKKIRDVNIAKGEADSQLEADKTVLANNAVALGKQLAGENKALQVAMATIDTFRAVTNTLGNDPTPSWMRIAAAAAVGTMGMINVGKIMSTDVGGGSSGTAPSIVSGNPSQTFSSGSFELSGGSTVEPVQAFVVTDDMSSSQDKLASIRRRATI